MRVRTRHPRLAAAACTAYGLTLWIYPAAFRREFGRELALTFRNQVEDVLDEGGIRDWLAFVLHIVVDTIRACSTLVTAGGAEDSISLLGLSEGDAAHGCLDRATMDGQFMFAAAGFVMSVVLTSAGWYLFFAIFDLYVS